MITNSQKESLNYGKPEYLAKKYNQEEVLKYTPEQLQDYLETLKLGYEGNPLEDLSTSWCLIYGTSELLQRYQVNLTALFNGSTPSEDILLKIAQAVVICHRCEENKKRAISDSNETSFTLSQEYMGMPKGTVVKNVPPDDVYFKRNRLQQKKGMKTLRVLSEGKHNGVVFQIGMNYINMLLE